MGPVEMAEMARIEAAADDIMETMKRHPFAISLFATMLNLASMLRVIDDLHPPDGVKACYAKLQAEIEEFYKDGMEALLRRFHEVMADAKARPN